MKRIVCLLLTLGLLLTLLSGCSRNIDNSGYTPTGDAILMEGEEPTEAEEEEDAQNLVLAYYPDRSLNPIFGSDQPCADVADVSGPVRRGQQEERDAHSLRQL